MNANKISDKKKAVLVTGGAGFIGSHVCRKVLSIGYQVYCIDNFCDFYNPVIKRNNIADMLLKDSFKLLEGDIRDIDFLERVFEEYSFDKVIHLAAMAGVRPSIENPRLYYDVNVNGTYNLLELAAKKNKDSTEGSLPFIFASSSSVYGNNRKVPFSETDRVDNPISPYAVTKKTGELICYNFHHLHHLPVICLRFFTVYGPGQRPDLAIHKFAGMILNDEPIPMYGDGSTKRDYTYIDDIVQGVIKAADYIDNRGFGKAGNVDLTDSSGNNSDAIFEIFNLGESKTISLSEMINAIEEALGKKAKIKQLPVQPGDVQQTYADITKSRKLLGYNPVFAFEDGLRIFVEWLKR